MDTKTRKADTKTPRAAAPLQYQSGFGNQFVSEAVPGALPVGRNTPQRPPLGLYAELISGTSFTTRARARTAAPGPTASSPRWCTGPTRASTTG